MTTRHPSLSDYDRDPDASPQSRQSRSRLARPDNRAPGTGYNDHPIGRSDTCWCGEPCDHDWPGKAGGAPHPARAKEHPVSPHPTPAAVAADLRALGYTPAERGRGGWLTLWGAGGTVRVEHPAHRNPGGPTLVSLAERLNVAGWAAIIQEDGWISVGQPWRTT
jgi:hypothetical protein